MILTRRIFFGGFPTGWTGYAPLNDEADMGMDSYIMFFAARRALDDAARAQHDRHGHHHAGPRAHLAALPIFIWGVIARRS